MRSSVGCLNKTILLFCVFCFGFTFISHARPVKCQMCPALYDLKTDPLEMNNLIGANHEKAKYEEVVGDLKFTLKEWMVKTKTPYIRELENTKQ